MYKIVKTSKSNSRTVLYCIGGRSSTAVENLETSVAVHNLTQTGSHEYVCPLCAHVFKYSSDLGKHMRVTHSDNRDPRPFKCGQCSKAYDKHSRLQRHLVTHTNDRPHVCPECGQKFKMKDDMNKHIRVMHSDDGRKHACDVCDKSFVNPSRLLRHQETHTPQNKPCKCDLCGRHFKSDDDLNRHKKRHSRGELNESGFTRVPHKQKPPGEPKRDRLRPDQMVPENLTCSYCGKLFKNRGILNKHVVKHTGERNHLCEQCGKSFRYKSDLITHKKVHAGLTPSFGCQLCDKSFPTRGKLARHAVSHSSQKPYPCIYCAAAFKTLDDLKRHQKRHQKRGDLDDSSNVVVEEQHECAKCKQKFKTVTQLRRHKQTHAKVTSDATLNCDQCELTFETKLQRDMHAKNQQNTVENALCHECGDVFTTERQLRQHRRNIHDPQN